MLKNKFLNTVTITGADDKNSPDEMLEIQKEFPFVEWGILFSQGSSYSSRFPSDKWIFKLLDWKLATTLRLSGHLCNGLIEDIVDGEWTFLNRSYAGLFKRLQLNFHGDFWDIGESLFEGFLTPGLSDFEIIFQLDKKHNGLPSKVLDHNPNLKLVGLNDLSHGVGVLPECWESTQVVIKEGYAGGLSPDNLEEELFKIQEAAEITAFGPTWIDAETHLRTNGNLDMKKVIEFLQIARPFVLES